MGPGLPARVEHGHGKDRRHDPQDSMIVSRQPRELGELIGIPGHGGFEEH
jgi:hypothetical protein